MHAEQYTMDPRIDIASQVRTFAPSTFDTLHTGRCLQQSSWGEGIALLLYWQLALRKGGQLSLTIDPCEPGAGVIWTKDLISLVLQGIGFSKPNESRFGSDVHNSNEITAQKIGEVNPKDLPATGAAIVVGGFPPGSEKQAENEKTNFLKALENFQMSPQNPQQDAAGAPPVSIENLSYSQSGEDRIVKLLFEILKVSRPSYLDIGAHHPTHYSNSAIFYAAGSRGVNIEPDKALIGNFLRDRPEDINLNVGVGDRNEERDFYVLNAPTLSTFSLEEAREFERSHGFKVVRVEKMPMLTLEHIIAKYCRGTFPDFLTLDVEGYERQIVEAIPFGKTQPLIICAETMSYSENGTGKKDEDLIRYLTDKGYMLYADTYINSIFVLRSRWVKG